MLKSRADIHLWLMGITFLVAILLSLLPLPTWAVWWQPEWVCLVLIYWVMATPYTLGMISVFILGIIIDLLQGTVLGEHVFCLLLVRYVIIKFHQLVRVYPLPQQTFFVFLVLLLYKTLIFLIQGFLGVLPHSVFYWISTVVSAVLWPWIFMLLRDWNNKWSEL